MRSGALVLALPSERISARLVLAPLGAGTLPRDARRLVQPLVDAGGHLLDSALTAETTPRRHPLRLVESHGQDGIDREPPTGSP